MLLVGIGFFEKVLQGLSVRLGRDPKSDGKVVAENAEIYVQPTRFGDAHAILNLGRRVVVKRPPVKLVSGLGLNAQRAAGPRPGVADQVSVHITKALKAKGMEPVAKVKFSRPDTDMTAQALIVKRSEADAIILYSIAKADAMMIRSLNKVGAKTTVICAWAASSPALPKFAGPLANGITVMQTYSFLDPMLDGLGKKTLADFMKKHDVPEPSKIVTPAFTAHAYDGMVLLGAAMNKAGLSFKSGDLAADRRKIRDALENGLGPVQGLIKTYNPAFTKDNHDSVGPSDYIMTVWQDGKLIPYKGKQDWGKKH